MKKTVYFSDQKVIEKIKNVPNMSRYISDLIIQDIEPNKSITREEVIKLILSYMSDVPKADKSSVNECINSVLSAID